MRNILVILMAVFFCSCPVISRADDTRAPKDKLPAASPIHAIEITEDSQAGAFVFTIDDMEVARLDTAGLHVNGNIDYSGTIADENQYPHPTATKRVAR